MDHTRTEEKYRSIIEQATDAIIVYSKEGKILEFNSMLCIITGYNRKELERMNVTDLLVGPLIKDEEKYEAVLRGETAINNRQIKRKDNSIVELEIKVNMLEDEKFLAFCHDITQHKKDEEELRRLKESYLALINNVDGIVWEANANTFEFTFISDNAERLLGYPKAMWIEQPTFWADHIYSEDKEWAIDYCVRCTKNKVPHDFEYRMIAADGRLIWLRDIVSVQVENGEPVKLTGIMVDITNQKISEEETIKKKEQLQILTEHLQEIREEERKSIAREIHDELGQQLTIMKMDISWLEENMKNQNEAVINKISEFKEMIDQTVSTVRRIAYQLRPSVLDDMGLVAAIESQISEFEKRSGIKAKYIGSKSRFPLSDNAKTALFRIVQESLTNIGRHAMAKNVSVSLSEENGNVVLKIDDDGVGFELKKLAFKKTLGIVGMKERCIMLGGEFNIDSAPGSGTKIKITIPGITNQDPMPVYQRSPG